MLGVSMGSVSCRSSHNISLVLFSGHVREHDLQAHVDVVLAHMAATARGRALAHPHVIVTETAIVALGKFNLKSLPIERTAE